MTVDDLHVSDGTEGKNCVSIASLPVKIRTRYSSATSPTPVYYTSGQKECQPLNFDTLCFITLWLFVLISSILHGVFFSQLLTN